MCENLTDGRDSSGRLRVTRFGVVDGVESDGAQ
jgi:hypothetical protein